MSLILNAAKILPTLWAIASITVGISSAQETETTGVNLLADGGFETGGSVELDTAAEPFKTLQERGVDLPARMPKFAQINPAHGWAAGQGCKFEYLTGSPDAEVHSGTHAIRITSPTAESGITVQTGIPVTAEPKPDSRGIVVGTPSKFSLYVKGHGTVTITCYLYDAASQNLYDTKLRVISPETIDVADPDKWQLVEGTLKITKPSVAAMSLVIGVKGEVSLDDVKLFANAGQ